MRRTLVIDEVAIDIPEDAFVDIKQFSNLGSTAEHVRTITHLPEQFDPPKTTVADNTVWMSRETNDEMTEWTVFLS